MSFEPHHRGRFLPNFFALVSADELPRDVMKSVLVLHSYKSYNNILQ